MIRNFLRLKRSKKWVKVACGQKGLNYRVSQQNTHTVLTWFYKSCSLLVNKCVCLSVCPLVSSKYVNS